MKTYDTPEPDDDSKNTLRGLGQKLKLHLVIPIIYVVTLITLFVISHIWKELV